MHLPQFITKSQQFLENHEREGALIIRGLYLVLTIALFGILGMMAYMSFFA